MTISIEHRTLPGRARAAGTWQRRFTKAKRDVVTHVTVHCDGRISELATCPRRLLADGTTVASARAEAIEAGWLCTPETYRDLCPAHHPGTSP